jgi:hypothetical protein
MSEKKQNMMVCFKCDQANRELEKGDTNLVSQQCKKDGFKCEAETTTIIVAPLRE